MFSDRGRTELAAGGSLQCGWGSLLAYSDTPTLPRRSAGDPKIHSASLCQSVPDFRHRHAKQAKPAWPCFHFPCLSARQNLAGERVSAPDLDRVCEADRQGQRRVSLSSNLAVRQSCAAPPRSSAHLRPAYGWGATSETQLASKKILEYLREVCGGPHVLQAQERTGKLEAPSQQCQP